MQRFVCAAALALLIGGCDTFDDDVIDYDGIIEVSLVTLDIPRATVRLVAVEDTGCNRPIETDMSRDGLTRRITVEGIRVPKGAECEAIIPARSDVEIEIGPDLLVNIDLEIRHAGETDEYRLSGSGLRAIRTTTTRLAD